MRAFLLFLLCGLGSLYAAAPVVSNISAAQRPNSSLVDITYDVTADFPTVSVRLQVSSDGGSTFTVPAITLSGAIGEEVPIGTACNITWDAGADWKDQYSTRMRFKVTVDDGNDAPIISDIANQSISTNVGTGNIDFTVRDDMVDPASLRLIGTSSNTSLVPNENIVFDGDGENRTVAITPASGKKGTTTITIKVSDGTHWTSDTFVLNVSDFVLIPKGKFRMGNVSGDADIKDAEPVTFDVDDFYMSKYEVTKAEWDEVQNWGKSNLYTDLVVGIGKDKNHPVHSITWYQAVKWCNARSEMEGLVPVYYLGNKSNNYYRTATENNVNVNKEANGYRLPTEAEWEKAARGGLSGMRFPWGDTISHDKANYRSSLSSFLSYDMSDKKDAYHPSYITDSPPYTSPVEDFADVKNAYGLHHIAGNIREWCWDWYVVMNKRVLRGGGWGDYADLCRVARRDSLPPQSNNIHIGFRLARSSVP